MLEFSPCVAAKVKHLYKLQMKISARACVFLIIELSVIQCVAGTCRR